MSSIKTLTGTAGSWMTMSRTLVRASFFSLWIMILGGGFGPLSAGPVAAQPGPDAAPPSATVAVIVGNGDYGRGLPDVPYAVNDARAMARFAADRLGVSARNLLTLEDADLEVMIRVFGDGDGIDGRLRRMVRAGVTDVVVYYSGHGLPGLDDGRAYLLPVDADPRAPADTGLALDDLYDRLNALHARSVTLYLEASFTGRAPGGALIDAQPRIPPAVAPFDLADGVAVISAAQPEQMAAWDSENRHGLFTEYLLRGLYGAADVWGNGDGDGEVTLNEVKAYLDKEMTFAARRDHGWAQAVDVSGVTDFVLASFDSADPPLRPLVGARDVATAAVNEVPLPDDPAPAPPEAPALSDAEVEPLPLQENDPLAMEPLPDFVDPEAPVAQPDPIVDPAPVVMTSEDVLWREVGKSGNPEDLKVYLLRYPDGRYADLAKIRFRRLLNGLGGEDADGFGGNLADRQIARLRASNGQLETELRQQRKLRKLKARNARLRERLRDEREMRRVSRFVPPPLGRWGRPRHDPYFGPPPPRRRPGPGF